MLICFCADQTHTILLSSLSGWGLQAGKRDNIFIWSNSVDQQWLGGASSSYCVRKYILTFKNLQVASYFEQLSHHNNVFSLKHPIFEGETNKFVNAFAGLSQ